MSPRSDAVLERRPRHEHVETGRALATRRSNGVLLLHRIGLSQSWMNDRQRCQAAPTPDERRFTGTGDFAQRGLIGRRVLSGLGFRVGGLHRLVLQQYFVA